LVAFGVWHSATRYSEDISRYAPREKHVHYEASAWWNGQWQQLAARRTDLAGGHELPLTFQWAGSRSHLKRRLEQAGWRAPPSWSLDSTLQWLSPNSTAMDLPVLPQMNDGNPAALVLLGRSQGMRKDSRLVLRLWRSDVRLVGHNGATTPVWLGAIVNQHLSHPYSLFSLVQTRPGVDRPRNVLAHQLPHTRLVYRGGLGSKGVWDGGVLLAREDGIKVR